MSTSIRPAFSMARDHLVGAAYYGGRQHGREERIADEHRHVAVDPV